MLSQARKAKIDILLLQELHAYEDGSHLRAHRTAAMLGWLWFAAPGELGDPASGVAVAIREASERITAREETLEVMLKGRCVSIKLNIDDIQYRIVSVYLSAQPGPAEGK